MQGLKSIARSNIEFIEFASEKELAELYRTSKALVFGAEEDFGITPVEAQAAGRPVIAFGKGGARETVRGENPNKTGMFFDELSIDSIVDTVSDFLAVETSFKASDCTENAKNFSADRFQADFKLAVSKLINDYSHKDSGEMLNVKKAHSAF